MKPNAGRSDNTPASNQAAQAQPASSLRRRLWRPNLIVFISNICIMTLELVAGRIIAPHVGVSLYTWTSVIGVVLAGISLGNYLGGRLADRWASLRLLGYLFLLSGVSSLGILAAGTLGVGIAWGEWPLVVRILVLTTIMFFTPCLVLGTISPVVAKLAVRDLSKTGSTVGKIYAAGALGSIVGTFATGFLLISWFGTYPIVWGVSTVLMTMGLVFVLGDRWQLILLPLLIIVGGWMVAHNRGLLNGPCTRETNYFCIRVSAEERDGEPVRVLILDQLVHSFNVLDDPAKLLYPYSHIWAEATEYMAQREGKLRALFIGGGGYTFPRYMEAVYPDSELHVIEIDPGVTEVAYDLMGLDRNTDVVTYNQDARLFINQEPTQEYDLVLGDAFNGLSVPYHLTTREFNDGVRAWLEDDGLYMINVVDSVRGGFVFSYVHTLRQTFRHVYLIPTSDRWQEHSRNTYVLIAAAVPLDLAILETIDAGDGFPILARQVLGEQEIDALLAERHVVTLTDQYAPVEQLLAPMISE
jgi:spermidine synthase